jgi:hypothetical protein
LYVSHFNFLLYICFYFILFYLQGTGIFISVQIVTIDQNSSYEGGSLKLGSATIGGPCSIDSLYVNIAQTFVISSKYSLSSFVIDFILMHITDTGSLTVQAVLGFSAATVIIDGQFTAPDLSMSGSKPGQHEGYSSRPGTRCGHCRN